MARNKPETRSDLMIKYKPSKYVQDPKFKLIPRVHANRCNFSDFIDTNLPISKSNSQTRMTNVESLQFTPISVTNNLSEPIQNSQKKTYLNLNNRKLKQIPVVNLEKHHSSKSLIPIQTSHIYTKNDSNKEGYQTKRKRNNIKDKTHGSGSVIQHCKLNIEKMRFECMNTHKNGNDNLVSTLHSNKVLRERRKVNYKEKLSIGTPEVDQKTVNAEGGRIPIYNQLKFVQNFSNEPKRDQYDFIPESDEDKSSDFSFHIDTPIKKRKIIKRRANALNIKHNCVMKTGKVIKLEKYRDKIENIMNNIRKQINKRNDKTCKQQTNRDNKVKKNKKNTNNEVCNVELLFNSTQAPDTPNISLPNESFISHSKERVKGNINLKMNLIEPDLNNELIGTESNHETPNILIHKESHISCNQENTNRDVINSNREGLSEKHHVNLVYFTNSPEHISNEDIDANDFFDFQEDIEVDNPKETTGTSCVKILENLVLTEPSIPNLNTSRIRRPIRNSWRFDTDIITRNPHFIDLKRDGLPSLSQDPVLDHTFDDRIKEVNTTASVPQNEKSLKQKSILNYLETDKMHFGENHHNLSLYNIHEYSPIKMNTTDKENSDDNIKKNPKRTSRRNVLGQINENIMTNKTSTPAKYKNPSVPIQIDLSLIEHERVRDVANYKNFGFDSCSEIIENEQIEEDKEDAGKPFRLEVNLKKYKKLKKLPNRFAQPVRDSEVKRLLVEDDSEFMKLTEGDGLECEEVRLFEDAEVAQNITRCYLPRTRKKVVITNNNPKKIDTECKLSKEAKKWIKKFNKMCEEVDDTELEVD